MSRVCDLTGKKSTTGFSYTRRGKAKYLGGVGTKVTGKTRRRFNPNLQDVRVVTEDGSIQNIKVSTRAIKAGMITKPLRQAAWRRQQAQKA